MKRLFLFIFMGCVTSVTSVMAAEFGELELELAKQETELVVQEVEFARQEAQFALQEAQFALQEAEIESRIDEARAELDKAARELAEVSRLAFEKERKSRSKKPVIGVLLADYGDSSGMLLEGVTPDGGAVEAGLQAGDRLTAINGVRLDGEGVKPMKRLNEVMETVNAGDTIRLEYLRDETVYLADVVTQERRAHVTKMLSGLDGLEIELSGLAERLSGLSEIGEIAGLAALSALENLDGLHLKILDGHHTIALGGNRAHLVNVDEGLGDYFGVDGGVLVVNSSDDSELESGDILLEVAGVEVATVEEAYQALGQAEGEVEAKVRRKKRVRNIQIAASEFPKVRSLGGHGPMKRVIRIERHGDDDVDVRVIIGGHDDC
ncbi:MAG: PDZ domain-containing protein [Gammaproteobacteria bacterium]|nr:PDZ domain-containing protein [Gammaproteobacteria bacterium]MCZ6852463.1 PDZ domain-containing protein [Gammaproteobacteria bacterium]